MHNNTAFKYCNTDIYNPIGRTNMNAARSRYYTDVSTETRVFGGKRTACWSSQ